MEARRYFLCLAVSLFILTLIFPGYQESLASEVVKSGKVKNVIIMIGDGMGPQSVGLLNAYAKYAPKSIYADQGRTTATEKLIKASVLGMAYHEAAYVLVTDSAASASQIATGKRALSETVGLDQDGNPAETILEKAKKMGKSTGLVSDTRLTHATPACFAAHQPHRSMENEIAADILKNNVDVMLSGGLRYWIPKDASDKDSEIHKKLKARTGGKIKIKSKRKDSRNLLDEAESAGYELAFTSDQLKKAEGKKLLGLFGYSAIPYRIDLDLDAPDRTVPTLKEMAMKALGVLSENDKGFFLMLESGLIDWSGHDNDAGTLLHEMTRFDETLASVYDWVKDRNDTLLIVTADHETGGFGFSYTRKDIPQAEDFPGEAFKGAKFAPRFNFGSYEILDKLYAQKISYRKMTKIFDALPEDQQTSKALAEIVNRNTEFPITQTDADAILAREKNEYFVKGHKYLKAETFPKINDFKEFYVYGEELRWDLLGRAVAKHQNVVWSTGTHTNTPVPLIVYGPTQISEKFGRLLHTTEWAQMAIDALIVAE